MSASAGALAAAGAARASGFAVASGATSRPVPTVSQLAWQRERLSMFVHLTVNTFTDREVGDGTESPAIFNPTGLDARQWASVARRNDFGSMILTAKHHDGFCLWPTKTTRHSVASSPWRGGQGDVVREFVDACGALGLRAGLYLSPWDRNAPSYGQGRVYDDYYAAQITELLSNYGPIAEVWFDGANGEGPNGKRQSYDWRRIHAIVRRLQPDAVIFSDAGPDVRWIGNEKGEAGTTCWSMVDPARVPYPGLDAPWVGPALTQGDPQGTVWRPGESDVSIRPGWFWHASEDDKVRKPDDLMELYLRSVGRNSKLLLNVPPTRSGLFHDRDIAALDGFGAMRRSLLAHDVAAGAGARGSAGSENPGGVVSSSGYWQAPLGARTGWVELTLPKAAAFDTVRLGEAIEHGQHIANHRVDAWMAGRWHTIWWGTTIGHERIARIAPCQTTKIRVVVEFAYDRPRLQRVSLHRWPT